MEVFTDLVCEFDSICDEINKVVSKIHIRLNEEQQLFVKDRINRCRQIIQNYKVELRFHTQTKNVLLNNQLASMETKLVNLVFNSQTYIPHTPQLVTTDDILSKADQIQKKDISLLKDMCKVVDKLVHK